ncbi:MAG: hypothetical protein NTV33_12010 [Coprothermobacterota bacterium]|jgi:hypothetical protein|nr:hypothetical protein [Coprothermobacterota bacterium]
MVEEMVKKEWVTPELIVLVRSKPEEAVLEVGKYHLKVGAQEAASNCMPIGTCGKT